MRSEPISEETKKSILRKMIRVRSRILREYPFFGYLVMHLQLGVTDCGTACTDMKHLLFDPEFAEKLTEEETAFVMLHEVMHCCLSHCTRDRGRSPEIYNIAADIVVNSNILYSMGIPWAPRSVDLMVRGLFSRRRRMTRSIFNSASGVMP